MQPRKTSITVIYGLIVGLAMILLTTVLYLGGVNIFLGKTAYLGYVILIGGSAAATIAEKKAQGGFLEFRDALKASFLVFVIALALQTLFNWILMNIIDPGFRSAVEKAIIDKTEQFLQSWGASQETIDKALEQQRGKNQYSLGNTLLGLCFAYVVFFLIALLIAAIVKKKRPEFSETDFK